MTMSEILFIVVSSFVFGYGFGYSLFDLIKSKYQKYEIEEFYLCYNKQNGTQRRISKKKLEEVKISDDCFFGEDLSYEQEFLNKVGEKIEKEIEGSEVPYFFSKRSMTVCFEISKMNKSIAKQLLVKSI